MLAGAGLPAVSAVLVLWVFRGYTIADHHVRINTENAAGEESSRAGPSVAHVLAITATLALLIQIGLGGELALLPLLVTNHLQLSAAAAGAAMLAVGLIGVVLLVPGGSAAARWCRRPTMVTGASCSAPEF